MLHIHPWQTHICYLCEVTTQAAYGAPWFHYFPAGRGGAGGGTQHSFTDSHTASLSIFLRVTRPGEKTHWQLQPGSHLEKKEKEKRKTQQGSVTPTMERWCELRFSADMGAIQLLTVPWDLTREGNSSR